MSNSRSISPFFSQILTYFRLHLLLTICILIFPGTLSLMILVNRISFRMVICSSDTEIEELTKILRPLIAQLLLFIYLFHLVTSITPIQTRHSIFTLHKQYLYSIEGALFRLPVKICLLCLLCRVPQTAQTALVAHGPRLNPNA